MNDEIKVALLANVLRAFGLPPQAIDELVTTVVDLTAEAEPAAAAVEPFCLRQHFLSAAEHRFYLVFREAAQGWAQVYPKVGLGSLFFARCGGYSQFSGGYPPHQPQPRGFFALPSRFAATRAGHHAGRAAAPRRNA